MYGIIFIFLFLAVYYFLVGYSPKSVVERPVGDPPEYPYTYSFTPDGVLETSSGSWKVPQHQDYYFTGDGFLKKDECFEKPDDFKVRAHGKRLHDFIHEIQQKDVSFNIAKLTSRGERFFFRCRDGRIKDLQACDSGNTFDGDNCIPITPCTNRRDGESFADALDLHFYYTCRRGTEVRKRCPNDLLFMGGRCTFPETCDDSYNIDGINYVNCQGGIPVLSKCPPGTRFFERSCLSDICFGVEDGKTPMRKVTLGPFKFSEGHAVCRDGRLVTQEYCPRSWEDDIQVENLFQLPSVYDGNRCTIPTFCDNVTSDDPKTIVPVYEFQKHVRGSPNSRLLDNAVGYECVNGRKRRRAVRPGNKIQEYREVSACDSNTRRVVVGDRFDRYYDCDTGTEIACPPDSFFNGKDCKTKSPLMTHSLKGVEMLKMEGLSPINGWMMPPGYGNANERVCEPGEVYIEGYDVCAHPDCAKFPFLKHAQFLLRYDNDFMCMHKKGKIIKVPRKMENNFSFWEQKMLRTNQSRQECVPGQKTKSGYLMMDSVLYATCDDKQPFVFCPSPHTKGIVKNQYDYYACEPKDSVYQGIIPPKRKTTFLMVELKSFMPTGEYFVDGVRQKYNGSLVSVEPRKGESIELESESEILVNYNELITYPPNNYFEDKHLLTYRGNYMMKLKGATKKPLALLNHHCKQV